MTPLIKGEAVIARQKYNLFDNEVEGTVGIYIKTDNVSGKHLIYFPEVGDWGELEQIERISPGVVDSRNKEFVSRVQTLEYTADKKLKEEKEQEGRND